MNKQLIEIAKRNSYSIEERGDLETGKSDLDLFYEKEKQRSFRK